VIGYKEEICSRPDIWPISWPIFVGSRRPRINSGEALSR